MKDKIKEILDRLFVYKNENDEMKYQPEDILTIDDVWLLLDYITNLQEEIKELKEDKSKMFETAVKNNNKLMDRIYNAIEYIGNGNLGIPRKTRDKFIKILKGENNE